MSDQEQTIYVSRECKTDHYDKRLISKIVKEVENGLPRKEAIRIDDLGKSSLDGWMRTYGSLEYQEQTKRKTYTNLQKSTIVTAIEQGRLTIRDAKIAYNIKSEKSIRDWIKHYKSEKFEICTVYPGLERESYIMYSKKNWQPMKYASEGTICLIDYQNIDY